MAVAKDRPPRHGQISVNTLKVAHAKAHVAMMTASAGEVANYGGHSVTGQGSQGGMSPGGASGADYQTTSTGNTGDADSTGSTGY
jgi:hypothetical protein